MSTLSVYADPYPYLPDIEPPDVHPATRLPRHIKVGSRNHNSERAPIGVHSTEMGLIAPGETCVTMHAINFHAIDFMQASPQSSNTTGPLFSV